MKLKFLSPFLFFIAVFCAYGQERLSWPLDEGWRYSLGDDMARAEESHDDSGWSLLSVPGRIELDGAGQYFWLRATVGIPAGYRGETLWFETGKAGCAFDVYADGIYIGSRGSLPPRYFTRMQQNLALLVPASLTGDGSVVLALRCYYNGSEAFLPGFALGTADHAEFVNYLQNLFNMRVYIILSVICLFLGSYFIAQFISRPDDRASIYYALSLIFIAFYFYDMGTERLFLDGLVQRAIGRASLTASLGFLMLFLMKFFEAPGIRIVRWVVAADIGLFTFAFLVNIGDDSADRKSVV